jgi:hypothetical protein
MARPDDCADGRWPAEPRPYTQCDPHITYCRPTRRRPRRPASIGRREIPTCAPGARHPVIAVLPRVVGASWELANASVSTVAGNVPQGAAKPPRTGLSTAGRHRADRRPSSGGSPAVIGRIAGRHRADHAGARGGYRERRSLRTAMRASTISTTPSGPTSGPTAVATSTATSRRITGGDPVLARAETGMPGGGIRSGR